MGAAPEGSCDDGGGLDLASGQARNDTADFLHRPADQGWLLRLIVRRLFGGADMLAWRRMAASIAKASMTSETCRCQPCQERVSLWSRPSSFLAVSKLSSMAQRCPSTVTSTATGVPAGHQIAFASPAQGHLNLAHPIDTVAHHPGKRHPRREGPLDRGARKVWLCRKGNLLGYVRRRPARRIVGPGLGQIESPVNKSVPLARDIGREYADLAVGDLARRAGVLPSHAAGGLALLQKTGLVNDQNGVIRRQVFKRIVAHNVAQSIGIPAAPPQDRLLPPGARITRCLGPHPACLALLLTGAVAGCVEMA